MGDNTQKQFFYVPLKGYHTCALRDGHLLNFLLNLSTGELKDRKKHEEGAVKERARDYNANWMLAVEILDDDIYLGAENNFNLFTNLSIDSDMVPLSCTYPDSDGGQILTAIFGTVNSVMRVIASLPLEQYLFLEKLQSNLRKVIKGVGGLSHEQWRSFNNEKKTVDAKNFLDGDLIETFLDLSHSQIEEIGKTMNTIVEELYEKVEELARLR
ncbi:hypothetical protein POTOM_040925 [Populus tomentosa]|uniref:RSE1/DDB1/CPSF1 C-terminal domain-containing protein n=1 Tax=Populus tomentosa TaxID=118781 RepID=A0A8X7YQ38_POPTO|nr:hypothetical protein POTOM_040925 [Populus tomentosa]